MDSVVKAILLALLTQDIVLGQLDDKAKYFGKLLGKLNSYHHQVGGEVYAVDESTLYIKDFIYDGLGQDTFFFAGGTNRPGSQGFIIPNEFGRTNILKAYLNKNVKLTLPDNKKISELKWFAIFDISSQEVYGDISIPEEFESPVPQSLSEMSRRLNGVQSGNVVILDAKTIKVPKFYYDGQADARFWAGVGPQPSSKGFIVPDEKGYIDNLRPYSGEDVILVLPGDVTVNDVDWLSIFNIETNENLGSVLVPDSLNVPPSLLAIVKTDSNLPNCETLHRDIQISWEIFGRAITFEIAYRARTSEYVAFGLSGSETSSRMVGSDAFILYTDGVQGHAEDYNITAKSMCVDVLGAKRGVCKDAEVGGQESLQFYTMSAVNGINFIRFRRDLTSPDDGDQTINTDGSTYIIWSMGRLDDKRRPTFHRIWQRGDRAIEFGRQGKKNCDNFVVVPEETPKPWNIPPIFDPSKRVFVARIGPSGQRRGYSGLTGLPSSSLAWYVDGYIVPDLVLKRGLIYQFVVEGGSDPHSATNYHPLVITNEPIGGYETLSESERKKVRVLAGVEFTRRGVPRPQKSGRLCHWYHDGTDPRLDDDLTTFQKYRNTLSYSCEEGDQARLEAAPNSSWPDVVYYHSFTHPYMGGKIKVVDSYKSFTSNMGAVIYPGFLVFLTIPLCLLKYVCCV
ncbi:protein Skeletor, isoforms B/C-like [Artemia franciscana]|uniref:Protein Skeletor n=1 Tax=Artemia franciscana TaxID=6661 RepID=A0AA88HXH7_ARTSF|nr:hypothetical protein QYM36_011483 [Artemia franciscana]